MRLQEVEKLRRENQRLAAAAEDGARMEERLGRLLQEKTALNAVNQIWSHLQVNVAHELRTPLAAIRGYVRMILDGRGGEVNDTQRGYLRSVCDNTDRLINTVSWMSYVAELSARHFKLSTFDLREVWAECAAASHELLREKAVQLTQQISQEEFVITGDREKLAYAISELLVTAVRFSTAGGTIAAEFSHGREREVIVRISQKGSPIPADTLDRIFDRPFNTIVPTAEQNVDAGALNLSGAYDYVGMHGGRVFVVSTAGQGATLMFTLPAVKLGGEEKTHEQAINSGSRRR
jgi:signal transduction histidine kinase